MNARFVAIGGVLAFFLAVLVAALPTAAQVEDGKGFFGDLKVGQMVEMRNDPHVGLIITYYDEPAHKGKMNQKIVDLGRDYIALNYVDPATEMDLEMRYPVNAIAGVSHVKKMGGKAAPGGPKKK